MRLVKWEKLPADMQTEEVREYYDVLRKKRFSLFWKRIFDIFVSAIMLIILSPLFLILAIAIKTDSKKQAVPEFATGTDRYIRDYGCAAGGTCA